MGIKGTVRRTTDGHLIHANIDTDIIISEEPPTGSTCKPDELYQVIERFAQGMPHAHNTYELYQASSALHKVCLTPTNHHEAQCCLHNKQGFSSSNTCKY